jgi:hypothetical protein
MIDSVRNCKEIAHTIYWNINPVVREEGVLLKKSEAYCLENWNQYHTLAS